MKHTSDYWWVPIVVFPAFLALFYAQYLIRYLFPDVTLIDLGVFYAVGFISGLSTGLSLLLSRRARTDQ